MRPGVRCRALGGAKAGRTGSQVTRGLVGAWFDCAAAYEPEARRVACDNRRHVTRPRGQRATARLQEILHPSVLQRMEGDNDQVSARRQQLFSRVQNGIELIKLSVYVQAERHECTGRGINTRTSLWHRASYDIGKLRRAGNRPGSARLDDSACDTASAFLLTKLTEQPSQFRFIQ